MSYRSLSAAEFVALSRARPSYAQELTNIPVCLAQAGGEHALAFLRAELPGRRGVSHVPAAVGHNQPPRKKSWVLWLSRYPWTTESRSVSTRGAFSYRGVLDPANLRYCWRWPLALRGGTPRPHCMPHWPTGALLEVAGTRSGWRREHSDRHHPRRLALQTAKRESRALLLSL